MKLHILYRHTNNPSGISKNRPNWFSYHFSLYSLINSIHDPKSVDIHILFDGTTIFDTEIYKHLKHIECFNGGSDWNSYVFAWNYAKNNLNLKDDDLIYIAENDYKYMDNWDQYVFNLYSTYDINGYVSLYDHPDKYDQKVYPQLQTKLLVTKLRHWRLTPSITGSSIFNKKILEEDYDIHTSNPSDHNRCITLSQQRQRIFLSPIPSLATHCEIEYLAPTIDWQYSRYEENFSSNITI